MIVIELPSEEATDRLGAVLAELLPPQAVIALSGTLGAGKTRFVQALAAAAGVPREDVVSPTFVLCQQYEGRQRIYHLDAYRIRDDDEWFELGVEEMFDTTAWVVIEWAERFAEWLPPKRVEIELSVTGPTSRRAEIRGPDELIRALRATYEGDAT